MKIEKFKKLNDGEYSLFLDEDLVINIHEDLILKYDLLLTKEVTDELKERLLEENKKYSCYNDALKYLNIKMRSIKEMSDYLKNKEYSIDIINDAIKRLKKENYLNDEIYSKYFITDRITLSNDGPYKIIKELEKRGIDREYINKNIELFTIDKQEEKIEKLINKQIKSNHNKSASILKRKILEHLINLGYDRSIIVNKLNSIYSYDDEEIKKKEYEKLYNKLSKKYSGNELEQRINKKMYERGFR